MRVIGWPPRTCHERVAPSQEMGSERNGTERHGTARRGERREREKERNRTETERETQGIGGAAGECLEVEDVRVVGWTGESRRRIWRGCEKAS